jgi:predicted acylesterase/phospholipase RssA
MVDRRRFLLQAGAAGLAPALLDATPASAPAPVRTSLDAALVLSGGGARGAYEAGIIWSLARKAGVRDGQVLPPYQIVCGSSIGALNGWFVATGQYSKLADVWHTIGSENLLRLKPKFEKIPVESAGVVNRLADALRLIGLSKNDRGVAESSPVLAWMHREVDPRMPLLMPLVWAVTDLNLQQPEYFYRLPAGVTAPPDYIFAALRLTVGPHVVVREATDELLHRALLASSAIPFVFDPVELPGKTGAIRSYVDGGVASNSPIGIARTIARSVDVILLDPREETNDLPNAVEVGVAAFRTMQRKILESEFQQAYFTSFAIQELRRIAPDALARVATDSPVLGTFLERIPVTEFAYMRPESTLPVGVGGFDDQENIGKTFDLGVADAEKPFTPYDWATFEY